MTKHLCQLLFVCFLNVFMVNANAYAQSIAYALKTNADNGTATSWADNKLTNDIVPNLNIGAGEFSPNPEYFKYGWLEYRISQMRQGEE